MFPNVQFCFCWFQACSYVRVLLTALLIYTSNITSVSFGSHNLVSKEILFYVGKIFLPPGGDVMIVSPGTDVEIAWTFDAPLEHVRLRWWRFFPNCDILATIFNDDSMEIRNNTFSGIEIKKPATLILKNVDYRYNGTYRFHLTTQPTNDRNQRKNETSDVAVLVAGKFLNLFL